MKKTYLRFGLRSNDLHTACRLIERARAKCPRNDGSGRGSVWFGGDDIIESATRAGGKDLGF